MKLSRTAGYAVRAVLQLAVHPPHVSVPCSHLAARGEMPERFLLQILRNLVTHGILKSTRGVDGGYYLSRPAAEISLLDVVEAVDGPLAASVPDDQFANDLRKRLLASLQHVCEQEREGLDAIKLTDLTVNHRA